MAAERGWPEEPQVRYLGNQAKLVSVLQEELQPGMVFLVEVVVDVLGEVGLNFRFGQSQPCGPLFRQRGEVLRFEAVLARLLKDFGQAEALGQSVQRVEPHRPEGEDERLAGPLPPLMRQIVKIVRRLD